MARNLKSVKVFRSDGGKTVEVIAQYDDRSQGRAYKTKSMEKFVYQGMSDAEVVQLRNMRDSNKRFVDWSAPKAQAHRSTAAAAYGWRENDEDARLDIEEMRKFEHDHPSKPSGFLFGESKEG